jgi:hypothetical protein
MPISAQYLLISRGPARFHAVGLRLSENLQWIDDFVFAVSDVSHTNSVPAFPEILSWIIAVEVMSALLPARLQNWMQASTLGTMDPSAK